MAEAVRILVEERKLKEIMRDISPICSNDELGWGRYLILCAVEVKRYDLLFLAVAPHTNIVRCFYTEDKEYNQQLKMASLLDGKNDIKYYIDVGRVIRTTGHIHISQTKYADDNEWRFEKCFPFDGYRMVSKDGKKNTGKEEEGSTLLPNIQQFKEKLEMFKSGTFDDTPLDKNADTHAVYIVGHLPWGGVLLVVEEKKGRYETRVLDHRQSWITRQLRVLLNKLLYLSEYSISYHDILWGDYIIKTKLESEFMQFLSPEVMRLTDAPFHGKVFKSHSG